MANPTGKRRPQAKKPNLGKPNATTIGQIQSAKSALKTSFGDENNLGGSAYAGTHAVMDYYQGLPKKQRQAAFLKLYQTIQGRDLSNWSGDPGNIALYQELPTKAREAYSLARGGMGGGGGGGGEDTGTAPSEAGLLSFSKGVSGATGEFITEKTQSKYKSGEAETPGPTKKKKKTATKLIKKAHKKSGVPRKKLRRAINTKGTSAAEKKLYAKAGSPKLSQRLRMADRRINKSTKKK